MAERSEGATGRMISFSDAIFAFAMTLLAFDLKVPNVPDSLASAELGQWMVSLIPKLTIYVFSFFIVGIYWLSHHRMFAHIVRQDDNLLWMNLIFLLQVSLLPLPAAVLAEYGGTFEAVALYALSMALCGLTLTAIWAYASDKRRHISDEMDEASIKENTRRGLASAAVFLVSIPIALFSPALAELVWVASFFARRLVAFQHPAAGAKKRRP